MLFRSIKIEVSVPEEYEAENITLPIVSFTKPDGSLLYETTLDIKQNKISDKTAIGLLLAIDPIEKPQATLMPNWLRPWMCFSAAFFFLALALLFAVRAHNLSMRKKKMAAQKKGGQREIYSASRTRMM